MKRLNFILLSSLAAATVALPTIWISREHNLKFPHHLTYIWGRETLLWIGEDYLRLFPNENDADYLLKLLLEKRFSIDNIIEEDYKAGKTLVLNGWVLSITEGRQCALFSLTRTY
ncbi:hypothetical protein [Confluentibacter citreus]|uniref:hypothetical protein n=1 Tax=Confluentibacter citreus TaxID=2007307 RepID=UPI000C28D0F4|nr:hypothetical protein [Confluentibacter citreus]